MTVPPIFGNRIIQSLKLVLTSLVLVGAIPGVGDAGVDIVDVVKVKTVFLNFNVILKGLDLASFLQQDHLFLGFAINANSCKRWG